MSQSKLPTYEEEFNTVESLCALVGYKTKDLFGEIHIITPYDEWYYIPREDGLITLMHSNGIGGRECGWHIQFRNRDISIEELIKYINQHTDAKFTKRFVRFT